MNLSVALILDILAVAIVIIVALIGRHRGFVKTLSWIIALTLSFSLASTFSNIASPVVSEKFVVPYLTARVEESIRSSADGAPQSPSEYSDTFREIGVPDGIVSDAVGEISKTISKSFSEPLNALTHNIAYKITRAVLFVVFFLILLLLTSLLLKLVNVAVKLPGLNFINKSLGLILGLLLGYLIVVVLSFALLRLGILITTEDLYHTHILKFFFSLFPNLLFLN